MPTDIEQENTRLRAALANSKDPCVYCQLPSERMAECRHGFPGCARADDMTGCPEFGAMLELHYRDERIAALEAMLRELVTTFNPEPKIDNAVTLWDRAAAVLAGRVSETLEI